MSSRRVRRDASFSGHKDRMSLRRDAVVPSVVFTSDAQHVELVDYEAVVERVAEALGEDDDLRQLVLFPEDDVTLATEPRERRTLRSTVPEPDGTDTTSLLVRECIKTYESDWHLVKYKYESYAGDVHRLPRKDLETDRLVGHQFEIDELTENDEDSVSMASLRSGVTKQGWLHKGNFTSTSSVAMKTFKRRFFHLSQQPDGSYALNFYKDDRSLSEPKGSIFLDACLGVVPNARLRRHAFELKMMDRSSVVLAADSDAEMDEWRALLHKVLQGQFEAAMQDNKIQDADRRSRADDDCPDSTESCESSDIQLQLVTDAKTHEETARVSRREGRLNVFVLTPEMQRMSPVVGEAEREARPLREKRASRILVSCLGFNLAVQACFSDSGGVKSNVEPFFLTLALYDLRTNTKVSADFHSDLNPSAVRQLLSGLVPNGALHAGEARSPRRLGEPATPGLPAEALLYPTQAAFTVCDPHPDVLLLVRIEKVLQGSVAQCSEPYLRADDSGKVAQRLLKQVRPYCGRMGRYRMPFCWAFRPLFRDVNGALDKSASMSPLFRQDGGRTTTEDWVRSLFDVHKSEKMSKLQTIPGSFKLTVENLPIEQPNMLTAGLSPVAAGWRLSEVGNGGGGGGVWGAGGKRPCVREVDDFPAERARHAHPHSEYANRLYVYPQRLKYDAQKSFPKAKNIAIHVEFRDSDEEGAVPLKCIYGKPGEPVFTASANTVVLHHQQCPDFCDEVKVELPVNIHGKHHLLFTFFHISCDLGKRRDTTEAEVGYAWLPLLREGRVRTGAVLLPVTAALPAGYLACQDIGLGKFVGPEVKWVDGGKRIFTVSTHLVSSVYTKDQNLHNFMQQCDFTMYGTLAAPRDLLNSVKSLNAMEGHIMISFMATLLTQLFRLLTRTTQDEVLLTTTSFLVLFVERCHEEQQDHHLHSYTRYVFAAEAWSEEGGRTVHEELVRTMELLLSSSVDQQLNGRLLKHLWFFFGIISKSMAQHVIQNQRLSLKRGERFPASFQRNLESLVTQLSKHVPRSHRDTGEEARGANASLAAFLMRCFTLMDRGFVFRLVNSYITSFPIMDSKRTFDFRIEFLQIVCSYEHYVALNLPVPLEAAGGPATRAAAPALWEFRAGEDFRRRRVLAGMLLQEVAAAAGEAAGATPRRVALAAVRALLAKHSLDDRYRQPALQARVATLYLPLLSVLQDNFARMSFQMVLASDTNPAPQPSPREEVHTYAPPKSASNTLEVAAFTFPSTLSVGAKRGDSRLSVASSDSNSSLHERRNTMDQAATIILRPDALHTTDVQTLLQCFLHVVKHAPEDALLTYWRKASSNEMLDFFGILEMCLHQFKYLGKRHYWSSAGEGVPTAVGAGGPSAQVKRSQTLPARRPPPSLLQLRQHGVLLGNSMGSEAEAQQQCLLAANLSTEVCLTVLDALELYTHNFKERLLACGGAGPLMQRAFGVYVTALRAGQSAIALGHVFASLHTFLNKFKVAFLRGRSELCGTLCLEALRCCGSRLGWAQACLLLHLLMRLNFEMSGRVAFSRTHTQVIVAVSRLMSEVGDLGGPRFQRALSTLNTYAASDNTVKGSAFAGQVKELTKRVRAVLTATLQMKEHERDPEMMVDLQHSLATSYAGMAELRKAWLESMARMHERNGDLSEAAMCHIHIAALMAKYLKRKGAGDPDSRAEKPLDRDPDGAADDADSSSNNSTLYDTQSVLMQGVAAFESVTPNVTDEETAEDDDCGTQDVHFSEDMLVEQLETCAHMLERAERFELLADVYKMIIPIYEHRRDFQKLSDLYMALHKAYDQILDATRTGRRLLGTYFRVAFFGQSYFEEDEWKEYIYKEPKLTGLSEISQRLQLLYADKFGAQNVRIIQDSNPVDVTELEPRLAYIQITYVQPFFSAAEQAARRTDFERGHNVRRFVFETPYTAAGRKHGDVTEQCKRRTVLTTSHTFPHVRKRVPVVARLLEELGPVQVAVDSMRCKVEELSTLCSESPANMIQLQLKLQGSVSTQVNAGPLAYARAFLDESNCAKYPEESVEELRDLFRQFVVVCGSALELNETLIKEDQLEYHEELKLKYGEMVQELSGILREMVMPQWKSLRNSAVRGSVHMYFNAVSQPASLRGVTGSSSSA